MERRNWEKRSWEEETRNKRVRDIGSAAVTCEQCEDKGMRILDFWCAPQAVLTLDRTPDEVRADIDKLIAERNAERKLRWGKR